MFVVFLVLALQSLIAYDFLDGILHCVRADSNNLITMKQAMKGIYSYIFSLKAFDAEKKIRIRIIENRFKFRKMLFNSLERFLNFIRSGIQTIFEYTS